MPIILNETHWSFPIREQSNLPSLIQCSLPSLPKSLWLAKFTGQNLRLATSTKRICHESCDPSAILHSTDHYSNSTGPKPLLYQISPMLSARWRDTFAGYSDHRVCSPRGATRLYITEWRRGYQTLKCCWSITLIQALNRAMVVLLHTLTERSSTLSPTINF